MGFSPRKAKKWSDYLAYFMQIYLICRLTYWQHIRENPEIFTFFC